MRDRIPRYPGRVTLTPVPGQQNTYDMARADDPIEEGSKLNVENLLPADVCELLGIDPVESELKDALSVLAIGNGKYAYQIKVLTQGGNPVAGAHITGVTAVNGTDLYTDDNGTALGVSTSNSVSLTVTSDLWDLTTVSQSVQSTGQVTPVTITMGRVSTPGKTFTSSTTGALSADVIYLDVSACGAGGGGSDGSPESNGRGGNGGGGGYVVNSPEKTYLGGTFINVTIGSSSAGSDGGKTIVAIGDVEIVAAGGKAGSDNDGGAGNGNGGGGGYYDGGKGGDATNGNMLYPSSVAAGGGGGGGSANDDNLGTGTAGQGGSPNGGRGGSPTNDGHPGAAPGGGGGGGGSARGGGAAGGRGEAGILWHYEGEE